MASESRVALVTGASRGIGRAIAVQLARSGHAVAVNYQANEQAAAETVAAVQSAGGTAFATQADVADAAAVDAMFSDVTERLGPVAILVNNAGIVRDTLLMRMSDEDWDTVIATDLRSSYLCTKAAIRSMIKARWGRIVTVSSVVGLQGNVGQANYAAAKAGMIGFTRSVAREVATRGITANAVAPGFITTDITSTLSDQVQQAILSRIPMERFGAPDDVAGAVDFLVSDAAAYITGQVLTVDGGMVMA